MVLVFTITLLGGFFALRFRDKLHLILGFSAGAVLGVAFLDLLPEAINLTDNSTFVPYIMIFSTLVYMVIDRIFFKSSHSDVHHEGEQHEGEERGILRAVALVVHSFMDGLAIGFSFKVSFAVGSVVTVAVLAHDFSDGINTVASILRGGKEKSARQWLLLDALAPAVGIIVGTVLYVKDEVLGYILAAFAGFFIYIALADLIPESFHSHPKRLTTIATIFGVLFLALAIHFAK